MSNCYDHEIKMNMLRNKSFGTYAGVKKELAHNKLELTLWFYNQLKMYEHAENNIETWYENYTGDELKNESEE